MPGFENARKHFGLENEVLCQSSVLENKLSFWSLSNLNLFWTSLFYISAVTSFSFCLTSLFYQRSLQVRMILKEEYLGIGG